MTEQQHRPEHPVEAVARAFLEIGAVASFVVAMSLSTCCCQFRDKNGELRVLGNCEASQLEDTCKGVLDPDHKTRVERMYEEDPDPDRIYINAQIGGSDDETGETGDEE